MTGSTLSVSLVCLFLSMVSGAPNRQAEVLIINGEDAADGEFPWQVSVQLVKPIGILKNANYHVCGGSIVNASVIVTAAHCFENGAKYRIVAGSIRLSNHKQVRNVRETIMHPKWDSITIEYDIALMLLSYPLKFDDSVKPISLAKATDQLENTCVTTGWGKTSNGQDIDAYPIQLQKVDINIVSPSECLNTYRNVANVRINDRNVCAGGYGKTACNGDSGGPLVCRNQRNEPVLTGITSFGVEKCGSVHPTVFTRVSAYHDWIVLNQSSRLEPSWILVVAVLLLISQGF